MLNKINKDHYKSPNEKIKALFSIEKIEINHYYYKEHDHIDIKNIIVENERYKELKAKMTIDIPRNQLRITNLYEETVKNLRNFYYYESTKYDQNSDYQTIQTIIGNNYIFDRYLPFDFSGILRTKNVFIFI